MIPNTASESISIDDLKYALRNLYDPSRLRKSPLLTLLGIRPGEQAAIELRRRLVEAIRSLKPEEHIPQGSRAWRIYHVLTYRYLEQIPQKQVASDMGLVIRQLRRLEAAALQALADLLSAQTARFTPLPHPKADIEKPVEAQQELEWIRQSAPCETTEIIPFVENILNTVAPLLEKLQVKVFLISQSGLPSLCGQLTSIRQALMSILTALGQCIPGGKISLRFELGEAVVRLLMEAIPASGKCPKVENQYHEALGLAQRLLELSGGRLEGVMSGEGVTHRDRLCLDLALPAHGELLILALDDNLDALHLMERFLAGSRYRLVPLNDPVRLLETAEALWPDVIILDVMLPSIDGWELLGRLREHPRLGTIPLIVSTILPQESLALTLGAAAFLHKPFSQETFRATLDRVTAGR